VPQDPDARTDALTPVLSMILRPDALSRARAHPFALTPGAADCAAIAGTLGLRGLRKLRFAGALHALGARDWELRAELGATVLQDCVVTTAPVSTRIDTRVERRYLHALPQPQGDEVEMPEDENAEALGRSIDIGAVALEALMLELPAFPRAQGAALGTDGALRAAPPGETPLADADLRPFAQLAALRARMTGDGGRNGGGSGGTSGGGA